MSDEKHPGGRPTKYESKYCKEIIEFFDRQPYEVVMTKDDDGNECVATDKYGKPVMSPCPLPTKEAFAKSIGIHSNTLLNWQEKNPEFLCAVKKAEDIQKDILIQNGLFGNYEKTFAIFVAKNVTDMNDKQELEVTETMTPFSSIRAKVDE